MLNTTEYYLILSGLLFLLVVFLIRYHYISFQKTKQLEAQRFSSIHKELLYERQLQHSYTSTVPLQIQELENRTTQQFTKIKVDLIAIDFTYKEILTYL